MREQLTDDKIRHSKYNLFHINAELCNPRRTVDVVDTMSNPRLAESGISMEAALLIIGRRDLLFNLELPFERAFDILDTS